MAKQTSRSLEDIVAAAVAAAIADAKGTMQVTSAAAPTRPVAAAPTPLSFRISEKGVVSVYGLGRFPLSLYVNQWDKLIGEVARLKQYVDSARTDPRVVAATKRTS